MRVSEYFDLGVDQHELDFVDIDMDTDVELFIDPTWIHIQNGEWFEKTSRTLFGYFDYIVELYEEGKKEKARELFGFSSEPNETCFGVSKGQPDGTGPSETMLVEFFDEVISNDMIENGLIRRLEDLHVFVEGFGPDRLSDLVTNVIRKHLVDFTKGQCQLYEIPLTEDPVEIGWSWNQDKREWEIVRDQALIVDNRVKLLVPKSIAVKVFRYNASQYCSHHVLVRRQEEHIASGTSLVQKRKDQTPYVNKSDIRDLEITRANKNEKKYVAEQTIRDTTLIERFRNSIDGVLRDPSRTNRLTNEDFIEIVRKSQKRLRNV